MKRNYLKGEKITVCLINQNASKRVVCEAVVTGESQFGPAVVVNNPAFQKPVPLELVADLLEETKHGISYSGEIRGAVLIPDFLWV